MRDLVLGMRSRRKGDRRGMEGKGKDVGTRGVEKAVDELVGGVEDLNGWDGGMGEV
jgi:hypothetical protein